eukprot:875025-Amorphochlora_amoeboformis.AAC.1
MDSKISADPLLGAPGIFYPEGKGNIRQLPFKALLIEAEFYIGQAFVTYRFQYKNTTKKNISAMFALPTEGSVAHFQAVFQDGRMVDTAIVANDDFESLKKSSKKGDESLGRLAEPIPDLFRAPIQNIKKGDTIDVTVQVLEELEFQPDLRYHLNLRTRFPPGIQDGAISIQFRIHTGR